MMKKFKLLGLLGVFSLLFTCFSSSDTVVLSGENISNSIYITARNFEYGNNDFTINCTFTPDYNSYGYIGGELKTVSPDLSLGTTNYSATYFDWTEPYSLTLDGKRQRPGGGYYYYSFLYIQLKPQQFVGTYHYTCTLQGTAIKGTSSCPVCPTCPTCPTCNPQYTSQQCQSVYDLIPSSDLFDCQSSLSSCQSSLSGWNNTLNHCSNSLNTCQSNLENCIQANCPNLDISTGTSTLYINDIRHESKPFIYVNIPEEFNWDYSTGINDFTIDISGYNVDTDYIAGIIDTQNYKPDESDFNKIITDVIPLFVPGLVIILFLYFIFRFIKKIF